jgi:hypothetical protein
MRRLLTAIKEEEEKKFFSRRVSRRGAKTPRNAKGRRRG